MPAVTMVMDSVIERGIIHTSRIYANLHKNTFPPVTLISVVIIAYITHLFSGSPGYLECNPHIPPVLPTASVVIVQGTV